MADEPLVGKLYENRGYIFRVDDVKDGQVFYQRWPAGQLAGAGKKNRVAMETWKHEMAGVKPGVTNYADG